MKESGRQTVRMRGLKVGDDWQVFMSEPKPKRLGNRKDMSRS